MILRPKTPPCALMCLKYASAPRPTDDAYDAAIPSGGAADQDLARADAGVGGRPRTGRSGRKRKREEDQGQPAPGLGPSIQPSC